MRRGEERSILARRLELERDDAVSRQVDADVGERDAGQAAVFTGRERRADVEETVTGRRLELRGRECRRRFLLVPNVAKDRIGLTAFGML